MHDERTALRVFTASGLMGVNLVVRALTGFALVGLGVRYLPGAECGLWLLLQSIAGYLFLADFGVGQNIVNRVGELTALRRDEDISATVTNGAALYVALVGVIWVAFVALCWRTQLTHHLIKEASSMQARQFDLLLVPYGTLVLARVPLTVFTSALTGLREQSARATYEIATTLVGFGAIAATLMGTHDLVATILVQGGGLVVLGALSYPVLKSRFHKPVLCWHSLSLTMIGTLAKRSGLLFLFSVTYLTLRSAPNIATGRHSGLVFVPLMFALLSVFRSGAWPLVDIVSRVLQPYVAGWHVRNDTERLHWALEVSTKVSFGIALGFFGLLILSAPLLFRMWVGRPIMSCDLGLWTMGIAFVLECLCLPAVNAMVASHQIRALAASMVAYSCTTVGLCEIMLGHYKDNPTLGIGLALLLATLCCHVFPVPLLAKHAFRLSSCRVREVYLYRCGGVLLVSLAALWPLSLWAGAPLVLRLGVYIPLLCAVMWYGLPTTSERLLLKGALKRRPWVTLRLEAGAEPLSAGSTSD